jgi:GTP-binding protein
MRREGYELQISQPKVIIHEENGEKLEPFEEVIVDCPQEYSGTIIETLGKRKGIMKDIRYWQWIYIKEKLLNLQKKPES